MTNLEKKIEALMHFATAEAPEDQRKARQEILHLQEKDGDSTVLTNPEAILRQILLDIGAPSHLIGYRHILMAVKLLMEDPKMSITRKLYPCIAEAFDSTASRVERAIRYVIEVAWDRGDLDVLNHYFGNTVSSLKGKPTNSHFLIQMAYVVQQRMDSVR